MDNKIVDTSFGINRQALSVMYLLNREPDFANYKNGFYEVFIQTKPWYNGRESGFVVSMSPGTFSSKKVIHIAVFEHRNSDQICALKWENERHYWNHPLEDKDIFDVAYKNKGKFDLDFTVGPGESGKMADWVYDELSRFYKENYIKKGGE